MALEAVVFPHDQPFGYDTKDLYNLLGGNFSYDDFGLSKDQDHENIPFEYLQSQQENLLSGEWEYSSPHANIELQQRHDFHQKNCPNEVKSGLNYSSASSDHMPQLDSSSMRSMTRTKRRRKRTIKNKEDLETQRMTHIAVERNRRKQMNEYLAVVRSLMPESYVQRGDQASIIGGAINFVKELEQELHTLSAQKQMKRKSEGSPSVPFSDFFTFPQYSINSSHHCEASFETLAKNKSLADIEVSMVECHANLKIRSRRRPKQLLRMVSWLHSMRLTVLHLNLTTIDQIVLYSLCVKVEDDCELASVDEIATAVYQMLGGVQEEMHS